MEFTFWTTKLIKHSELDKEDKQSQNLEIHRVDNNIAIPLLQGIPGQEAK